MALTSSDKRWAEELAATIATAIHMTGDGPIRMRIQRDDAELIARCLRRCAVEIPRSLEAARNPWGGNQ